jgi:hypothetical protein
MAVVELLGWNTTSRSERYDLLLNPRFPTIANAVETFLIARFVRTKHATWYASNKRFNASASMRSF